MAFDNEPESVAMMDKYLEESGYVNDFTGKRRHHEIYLSGPRKTAPEKCKTVIRHPIRKTVKQVDFLLIFLRYHYNFILFCLKIKYIFYIM